MRTEAAADAADEPLLSSFLYASVLSHPTFGRALAFVLANRLADATLLATELMAVFEGVMREEPAIERAALADVVAVWERDPACTGFAAAFLHFKGYHAIQAQRVAHALWGRGQRVMARALQSRSAEVFAVDIHPAARIGSGILLDHGTGVVIGETAVVGNHVSLMQNVTLGGTGKDAGDRHPRIGDNVLIGAGATVLGAIDVGKGAQVAAGSLVLKPVAPRTMVAGSPAAVVGVVHGNPAHRMQQWLQTLDSKRAPAWDAALGTKADVQTLDGTMTVTLPPGSSSGRKLRLKGKGLHRKNGERGDLLVRVMLSVPATLTESQRAAFEALRDQMSGDAKET
jgi:serine O-acetyltransferase